MKELKPSALRRLAAARIATRLLPELRDLPLQERSTKELCARMDVDCASCPQGKIVKDSSQIVSAFFTIAFAAVMLVAGQQFIEYKSKQTPWPTDKVIATASPAKLPAR
jgi:hypothetical protein